MGHSPDVRSHSVEPICPARRIGVTAVPNENQQESATSSSQGSCVRPSGGSPRGYHRSIGLRLFPASGILVSRQCPAGGLLCFPVVPGSKRRRRGSKLWDSRLEDVGEPGVHIWRPTSSRGLPDLQGGWRRHKSDARDCSEGHPSLITAR